MEPAMVWEVEGETLRKVLPPGRKRAEPAELPEKPGCEPVPPLPGERRPESVEMLLRVREELPGRAKSAAPEGSATAAAPAGSEAADAGGETAEAEKAFGGIGGIAGAAAATTTAAETAEAAVATGQCGEVCAAPPPPAPGKPPAAA